MESLEFRSCSPGAWKKVQEGTPGGLVCVVSNENVCFPTRRTKIFPDFFLEIFNVLFVFYTSNIFYPHSPFFNCQYPLLTASHHIK